MKKRKRIGMVIGNINTDFTNELVSGAKKCASDYDTEITTILVEPLVDNQDELDIIYEYYRYMDIDALVIMYASISCAQRNPERFFKCFRDLPLVFIQTEFESTKAINSNVVVNNKSALKQCVEHLIVEHDCKNICYVSGPKNNYESILRKQAYIETLREHDLDLNDKMMVYGDFSANVSDILEELLANNPKVEGIVFANDTMALASYEILENHGYKIGKDILITGFDDVHNASFAHPGLTTVNQDTFGLGYEAFREAINLIKSKKRKIVNLDTEFVIRESCGCRMKENSIDHYINDDLRENVDRIINDILKSESIKDKRKLYQLAANIESVAKGEYDFSLIKDILKDFIGASSSLLSVTINFLYELFKYLNALYPEKSEIYIEVLLELQNWLFNYSLEEMRDDKEDTEKNIIKSTFLLRKAFENDIARNNIIELTLEQFKKLGISSAYIYLYNSGFKMSNSTNHILPENILLAGYYDDDNSYSKTIIGNKYSFRDTKISIPGNRKISEILSVNDKVYGFIICNDTDDKLESIKTLCVQLSTLLYFCEIKREENRVREELEKSYLLIERKNEILNNISKVDELTAIYNRRGFIELAQDYISKNSKKNLELLFIDLDHLKEINDKFGHGDGDFAIKKIAEALEKTLPDDSIIGRLGGDEFVALYYTKTVSDTFYKKIKKFLADYNSNSDKPYYVETSIGRVNFESSVKIDLADLLSSADKILYEDKKKRKETIVK